MPTRFPRPEDSSRTRGVRNDPPDQTSGSNNKEGIVQRLQSVLVAVRRDRDREHRARDIALEKLRAAKEALKAEEAALESDKAKFRETRELSEATLKEIETLEVRIHGLQQTYQFQHEDLLRKREKIRQQTDAAEAAASRRDKSLHDARQRLEFQRDKHQKLQGQRDEESKDLLAAIVSEAITNKILHDRKTDDAKIHEVLLERVEERQQKRKQSEKEQEAMLAKEFPTMIDFEILPKLIAQRASTMDTRTDIFKAEVHRLEAMDPSSRQSEVSRLEEAVMAEAAAMVEERANLEAVEMVEERAKPNDPPSSSKEGPGIGSLCSKHCAGIDTDDISMDDSTESMDDREFDGMDTFETMMNTLAKPGEADKEWDDLPPVKVVLETEVREETNEIAVATLDHTMEVEPSLDCDAEENGRNSFGSDLETSRITEAHIDSEVDGIDGEKDIASSEPVENKIMELEEQKQSNGAQEIDPEEFLETYDDEFSKFCLATHPNTDVNSASEVVGDGDEKYHRFQPVEITKTEVEDRLCSEVQEIDRMEYLETLETPTAIKPLLDPGIDAGGNDSQVLSDVEMDTVSRKISQVGGGGESSLITPGDTTDIEPRLSKPMEGSESQYLEVGNGEGDGTGSEIDTNEKEIEFGNKHLPASGDNANISLYLDNAVEENGPNGFTNKNIGTTPAIELQELKVRDAERDGPGGEMNTQENEAKGGNDSIHALTDDIADGISGSDDQAMMTKDACEKNQQDEVSTIITVRDS